MATIKKQVCDRCGKEIKYKGWTGIFNNIFKRDSKIDFTSIYDGNRGGYDYSQYKYELCADCTEKIKDFLRNKEELNKRTCIKTNCDSEEYKTGANQFAENLKTKLRDTSDIHLSRSESIQFYDIIYEVLSEMGC